MREAGSDASLQEQAPPTRAGARFLTVVADDLAKVKPPAEVRVAHEDYVAGSRGLGRFMTRVAQAMARGDQKAVSRMEKQLLSGRFSSALRLRRARAEFQALGYRLPGEVAPGQRPPDQDLEPGEGQVPVPDGG